MSPTAPVLADGTATFTPGISERRSGVSKFLHQDYLGSTKQITGSNQAVTDTRQYDAFGLQTGSTGTTPTPFGFAGGWGYQQDATTGLQLLGHRYYDPSTGRFLTRDPIQDGRNWYGYCENNPIDYIDPTGNARRRGGRLTSPQQAAYEKLVELEVEGTIADAEIALVAGRTAKAARDAAAFARWFNSLPPAVQRALIGIFGIVQQIADEAAFGPGGGSSAHAFASKAIDRAARSGAFPGVSVKTEVSILGGREVDYGTKGSVRHDVVVMIGDEWFALFDHKFGKAKLTEARRRVLESAIPKGAGSPKAWQTPLKRRGSSMVGPN